ncbi:hypothetical protein DXB24_29810, partial [Lachnospiraceae bacterium OM02-3]
VASFATLVPLRVYPSESVPSKDLCIAGPGSGKRGISDREGYSRIHRPIGWRGALLLPIFTFFYQLFLTRKGGWGMI